MWSEVRQARVFPVSKFFSVPASISEHRHLPWFYEFLAKDIPLQILIGWTRQNDRLLNLNSSIRKKSSGWGLEVLSATCYVFVKLKFGVQKDPAKITTSLPVKV
jgi:hypothetical protein